MRPLTPIAVRPLIWLAVRASKFAALSEAVTEYPLWGVASSPQVSSACAWATLSLRLAALETSMPLTPIVVKPLIRLSVKPSKLTGVSESRTEAPAGVETRTPRALGARWLGRPRQRHRGVGRADLRHVKRG